MQLQSNNYKQIIQMKRNMIKDPNCQGANQLAIYKSGREVELEQPRNKFSWKPDRDSNWAV